MSRIQKSTRLYAHPFSRDYWHDAAAEMQSTKMLVVTALMIALRIAMKPMAIPIFGDIKLQVATLATALGAMIFGPVVAIPAALVSDTVGFMLFPTGDYFLPFALAEIASTMIYALFLYRANVSTVRVLLARFLICSFVNIVLMQLISAWSYDYFGKPQEAKDALMGITAVARILKNICFFPIETVVLTLFLRYLMPVTRRAKLTYCSDSELKFTTQTIILMVALVVIGSASTVYYLDYRYDRTSRSADYSDEQRVEANRGMTELVLEKTDDWDAETVVCIVDSAFRPMFEDETDYTVSVYILDEAAFAAGQAADEDYSMDTLWGYSKSGPKNDEYQSLIKVATAEIQKNEKTGEILSFEIVPVE